MKFKIDQNLPLEFEKMLEADGHDAISVFRQGLNGESDEKIVSICHDEGRALMTADLDLSPKASRLAQRIPACPGSPGGHW